MGKSARLASRAQRASATPPAPPEPGVIGVRPRRARPCLGCGHTREVNAEGYCAAGSCLRKRGKPVPGYVAPSAKIWP